MTEPTQIHFTPQQIYRIFVWWCHINGYQKTEYLKNKYKSLYIQKYIAYAQMVGINPKQVGKVIDRYKFELKNR